MITVRKVKLIVNSEEAEEINRTYKFIRDSIYAQYQGLNRCMGYLLSGYYANGMDIKSDGFKNYIKIGDNGIELMELQTRYRRGEISDNDLTQEQIDSLCMLYDKQIEEIKRQIEVKERKLSEYKRKNKGKIKENNA